MNLHRLLQERAARGRPLRVVLIGAGKFGSMYLSQAQAHARASTSSPWPTSRPARARGALARVGLGRRARTPRASLDEAARSRHDVRHRRRGRASSPAPRSRS